jgi:hypothetical protein
MTSQAPTPNKWIPNEDTRRYIYNVLKYAMPLIGIAFSLTTDQLDLWQQLAAAVLGIAAGGGFQLAASNTPRPNDVEEESDTSTEVPQYDASNMSLQDARSYRENFTKVKEEMLRDGDAPNGSAADRHIL